MYEVLDKARVSITVKYEYITVYYGGILTADVLIHSVRHPQVVNKRVFVTGPSDDY